MAIYTGNKKCKLFIGNKKIKKAYLGSKKVYSSGNIATYYVDSGVSYREELDEGKSCLSPKTFTPAKSGYTFIGWREDKTAASSVLTGKVMGDNPVTLYAVFRQTITLSYAGNGNTGGSTAAQSGYRYYNNGNVANPSFTVKANGFTRTGYLFTGWRSGSYGYAVGQSVTLSSNLTLTAQWEAVEINISYTGESQTYVIPVTGLYLFTCYGGRGGGVAGHWQEPDDPLAGGEGGTAKKYASLTKGTTIYIVCGGMGETAPHKQTVAAGGYNGGGYTSIAAEWGLGGGGGATHVSTGSGLLSSSSARSGIICAAGGGGGAGEHGHGGNGGGLTGEDGTGQTVYYTTDGGTQSGPGDGHNNKFKGSAGQGAVSSGWYAAGGGGGGWYGGNSDQGSSGAGGSGYIGAETTVYNGITYTNTTIQGGGTGNGSVKIELIAS